MKRILLPLSLMALMGCTATAPSEVSRNSSELVSSTTMRSFPNEVAIRSVQKSNVDIAQEFLDLSFALESGQKLSTLTKFSGPISIGINGTAPKHVVRDLELLITRLKSEAGLDVRRVSGSDANIHIETIPKRQLQSVIPTAACFVVPNVSSWSDYRRNRFKNKLDWTRLSERKNLTVFMPNDVAPQEARDCLHEEIAQALGPVNDLYRLPDSVFNDDNFHITLTPYDMLILRTYYSPELRNGMSRHEVAAILPDLLARLNPIGQSLPAARLQKTSKAWVRAIEVALGPKASSDKRRNAAFDAVKIAQDNGYRDHRLGFAHYARAQVSLGPDPKTAASDFARAYSIFRTLFGTSDIHTAQVSVQMASLALSAGHYDAALKFINESLPVAQKSQNGSLLFSLLAMKAEVYEGLGRFGDAKTLRREAISWGHYGLATRSDITKRLDLVASLRPRVSTKGF
ncbi:DUF2927 domain-containing protein [Amylibacter sp. SFDW26]|uniref:DUF2927 domain-containing protein n=1 Tax=Amylibacter sp. SFDW26 TaxID=2652722 RepID=UPI0012628E89|nr:DUF2927 domain-containing protein [Amylibacter sp. SFDW26]KAB7610301.1 DUF2927 domain-containing protein [Amylibacter sp. SFDW26]